jgi:hypothetical protein
MSKRPLIGDLSFNPNHNPQLRIAARRAQKQSAAEAHTEFALKQPPVPATDFNPTLALAGLLLFYQRGAAATADGAADGKLDQDGERHVPGPVLDALISALPQARCTGNTYEVAIQTDGRRKETVGLPIVMKPNLCCCRFTDESLCASLSTLRPGTQRLVLDDLDSSSTYCVAGHTSLSRELRTVVVRHPKCGSDPLDALLRSPAMKTVRRLELWFCPVSSVLRQLADPTVLPLLNDVVIGESGVNVDAVLEILRARTLAPNCAAVNSIAFPLCELSFSPTAIGPFDAITHLTLKRITTSVLLSASPLLHVARAATCRLPNVIQLDISDNEASEELLQATLASLIPSGLQRDVALKSLDISGNVITDGSIFAFLETWESAELESLRCGESTPWLPGAFTTLSSFVTSSKARSLCGLSIAGCSATDEGSASFRRLLVALKRSPQPITRLNFGTCHITGTDVRHVANSIVSSFSRTESIEADAARSLVLRGNAQIDLTSLAPALPLLTELDLSYCPLTDQAISTVPSKKKAKIVQKPDAPVLSRIAVKLVALRSLGLSACGLTDDNVLVLAQHAAAARVASPSPLISLDLSHNEHIRDGKPIASLLASCVFLNRLSCASCPIEAQGVIHILEAVGVVDRAGMWKVKAPTEVMVERRRAHESMLAGDLLADLPRGLDLRNTVSDPQTVSRWRQLVCAHAVLSGIRF